MKRRKIVIAIVSAIITVSTLTSLLIYARIKCYPFIPASPCSRNVLKEDYTEVNMIIAISDGSYAYRFMIDNDGRIIVSYGERKRIHDLFNPSSLYICEITSMDFMQSISEEAEITLDEETYTEMISLTGGMIEEDEEDLFTSAYVLTVTIITQENLCVAIHWRGIREGFMYERYEVTRLASILKNIVPFAIEQSFDEVW